MRSYVGSFIVDTSRSIVRDSPNDSSRVKQAVGTGLPPPTGGRGMRLRTTVLERAPVAGTEIERSDLNAHFCASLCNPAEFMTVIYLIIRGFTRTIRKDQTILRTHARTRPLARVRSRARERAGELARAYHIHEHAWRKFRASAFTSSISSLVLHGRLNVELLILLARGTSETTVRSTAACLNKGTFAVIAARRGSVVSARHPVFDYISSPLPLLPRYLR